MTNRRRSATTRSVPAQTPEQLLELTQEHIRPLTDRPAQRSWRGGRAEGDQQTTHAALLQGSRSLALSSLNSRSARRRTGRAAPRVRSV